MLDTPSKFGLPTRYTLAAAHLPHQVIPDYTIIRSRCQEKSDVIFIFFHSALTYLLPPYIYIITFFEDNLKSGP